MIKENEIWDSVLKFTLWSVRPFAEWKSLETICSF